jgi:hypothetical protein
MTKEEAKKAVEELKVNKDEPRKSRKKLYDVEQVFCLNTTELLELHYAVLDFEQGPTPYNYLKLKYTIHSVHPSQYLSINPTASVFIFCLKYHMRTITYFNRIYAFMFNYIFSVCNMGFIFTDRKSIFPTYFINDH